MSFFKSLFKPAAPKALAHRLFGTFTWDKDLHCYTVSWKDEALPKSIDLHLWTEDRASEDQEISFWTEFLARYPSIHASASKAVLKVNPKIARTTSDMSSLYFDDLNLPNDRFAWVLSGIFQKRAYMFKFNEWSIAESTLM